MLAGWTGFASASPVVATFERFYAGATDEAQIVDGGLLLLNELNCTACHAAPESWRDRVPGRGRISLAGVGSRLSAAALQHFVADPRRLKPGTIMPALVRDDAKAAEALAAYLASLTTERKTFPAGDTRRGQQLYESIGCVACHAPAVEATTYASVPLGLAQHYDRDALVAFLLNPLHTRPAGRMPATELTETEAADVAAFLQVGRVSDSPSGGQVKDLPYLEQGRALFGAKHCVACHDTGGQNRASPPLAKPIAQLRAGAGCLAANPPAGAPDFSLSPAQTRALGAALRAIQAAPQPPALLAEQRLAKRFEQLNCYACHEWRGRGEPEPARAKFFTATDAAVGSLGQLGHLPPALDAAGRKLTPHWLAKVLWGHGGGVRPYLSARMPRFGEAAAGDLVPLLAAACRPARPQTIDVSGSKGHQRFATGRTLLGTGPGGLGCVACHGLKTREPSGVRAINLTHTAQRLQPEYFKALLLDPQGVQPGTIMPPLFAGRRAADNEIESMWTYFKELDQSDVLPDGLAVAGSFELKPAEEGRPIVFRTFLEGAGTQAIAVGFPAGLHAAFDAFEVRWALAWRGRFLDAQTNWEERPMKPIKPLGGPALVLPTHLPLARVRDTGEPWPTKFGAYAGYVFKGYRLEADGTPVFRYRVDGLEVEDSIRPTADGASLRRMLVVRGTQGEGATWHFRGVNGGVAPIPLDLKNGSATITEMISW